MTRKHSGEIVLGLALIVAFFAHVFVLPPVSQSKLDRLNKSMTRAEVLEMLGKPTRKMGPDGSAWQYSVFLRFGYVDIVFDHPTAGNFSRYNYEEF